MDRNEPLKNIKDSFNQLSSREESSKNEIEKDDWGRETFFLLKKTKKIKINRNNTL